MTCASPEQLFNIQLLDYFYTPLPQAPLTLILGSTFS